MILYKRARFKPTMLAQTVIPALRRLKQEN